MYLFSYESELIVRNTSVHFSLPIIGSRWYWWWQGWRWRSWPTGKEAHFLFNLFHKTGNNKPFKSITMYVHIFLKELSVIFEFQFKVKLTWTVFYLMWLRNISKAFIIKNKCSHITLTVFSDYSIFKYLSISVKQKNILKSQMRLKRRKPDYQLTYH